LAIGPGADAREPSADGVARQSAIGDPEHAVTIRVTADVQSGCRMTDDDGDEMP
jgi:hypothetical protein